MKNLFFICSLFIIVVQLGYSSNEEDVDDTTIDDVMFTEYLTTIKENVTEFSMMDLHSFTTNRNEYEHTTDSSSEEYSMSTVGIGMDTVHLTITTSEGTIESSNNILINEDELQGISTTTENHLMPKLHISKPTIAMSNKDQDLNGTTTDSILLTEHLTTLKENVDEFSMLDLRNLSTQTNEYEHTTETPVSTTLDEVLLKEYSMSSEKNITVLENPFGSNVTFEDEITAVTHDETLNKEDATSIENAFTELTTFAMSEDQEGRDGTGITLNETLHKADSTLNGIVLTELTTLNEKYATSEEKEEHTTGELVVTEDNSNGFKNTTTTSIYENLTISPKIQNDSEEINPFTIFMVQKQCTINKSTEVFDKYPDLRVLVEEVEDCLYFAFIKIRAKNPTEIKEALRKLEEKQFHVIKVKQNAGNQDKSRLVLKEHLDCKECLVKGKDIKASEDDIGLKNDEKINTIYDVNDLSLYLALAGSVIASSVLIANVYLCYCRRKQGHSEIPTFNSKPEKFKMTPIPRPSILNGDNVFSQNYLSGRSMNPLRSPEQQAFGNYPRNENRGSDFRESGQWMPQRKQVAPKSELSEFPFIENPTFQVW